MLLHLYSYFPTGPAPDSIYNKKRLIILDFSENRPTILPAQPNGIFPGLIIIGGGNFWMSFTAVGFNSTFPVGLALKHVVSVLVSTIRLIEK